MPASIGAPSGRPRPTAPAWPLLASAGVGLVTVASRLEMISALNRIYARLGDMVIRNHPTTEAHLQQQRQLLNARDYVGDLLDTLLDEGVSRIGELAGPTANLAAQAADLDAIPDGMNHAAAAGAIAVQVIQTVAQIVALIT
jgi:hypothetical protein